MKRMATGMLVVMAGVYLLARAIADLHPAVGFVKAFAEAAMVGGLADWFAVTALFRHPLGLPIPHTAIIPRNKDRIGATLAQFLKDNFLTPAVVARRMRHMDVAAAAGRFLADPDHGGAGRLREGASRLLADILDALDDDRLGGMAKGAIASRIRTLEVSPLLGQSLEAAMAEGRHIPLLDGIINRAALIVTSNEEIIRDMVHERAGRILRWTGLDENVADALITGLNKLLYDMADFPDHPLRIRVNEMLADLGYDLQHDREMQAKVARLKEEIVENPAMQRWIDGLWEQARAALLRAARDPDKTMAGKFGEALRQLGTTLQQDDSLRDTINRFARRATVGATASYGDSIVRLVSDTVRGWDASRVTERVENAVGRDLQYIRINGTLVGGLVGLGLHAVDVLL
ncbi:MAG: DUF445 domain-containing protein [Sphingomonadales bacterium]|nr:DUF445 domain-containing protein [Sphingomonadales bacterium]MBL0114824.1 DUF445 domain-containing protein [Sphingomonadales bacterium]